MFKKTLQFIVLCLALCSLQFPVFSQCTSCDITQGSGGGNINLNANQTLCITGAFTGSVNFNGSGAKVCIATNASWTPSNLNLNQQPTIDVYGTFAVGSNLSNEAIINIKNGGLLHGTSNNFEVQKGTIIVESGGTLSSEKKTTFLGSAYLMVESGGIASFNTSGSSGVGLENNHANNLEISGVINVNGIFYNHGKALINTGGIINTDELITGDKGPGNILENNGRINISQDADISGHVGGLGEYIIDEDLSINSNGVLDGGYWQVGGFSTFDDNDCSGQISTSVIFYDETSSNGGDFDNGCSAAEEGYTVLNSLPVELLEFDVREKPGNAFELYWVVADEFQFSHYELEKSDERGLYMVVETLYPSDDQESTLKTYLSGAYPKQSYLQTFRLRMVSMDGSYEYSPVVAIKGKKKPVSVYPSPVSSMGKVTIEQENQEPFILNVYTKEGQLIHTKELSGQTKYEQDLSSFGTHQLFIFEIIAGYDIQNIKILVTR